MRRAMWCVMTLLYLVAATIILAMAQEYWHALVVIVLLMWAHNLDSKLKSGGPE